MRSIISILIVLLILGGGGFLWYQSRQTQNGATSVEEERARIEQRLQELRKLKNLTLDTSVLNDPVFNSLKPIIPSDAAEPTYGRRNPFQAF